MTKELPLIVQENPGLWDGNKTIKENAAAHHISYDWARQLVHKHNLPYKVFLQPLAERPEHWNENLTLADNARMLKKSYSWARIAARKFKLQYMLVDRSNFCPDRVIESESPYASNRQMFAGDLECVFI